MVKYRKSTSQGSKLHKINPKMTIKKENSIFFI